MSTPGGHTSDHNKERVAEMLSSVAGLRPRRARSVDSGLWRTDVAGSRLRRARSVDSGLWRTDVAGSRLWRARMALRLLAVSVATSLCLTLTACSSLPRAGAPQPFDIRTPVEIPIDFVPGGPLDDSTPETLVRDFLLACAAGFSDDFAAARSFFASTSTQQWDPMAQVQIFSTDTSPQVSVVETSAQDRVVVTLVGSAIASLDADGILTRATASALSGSFTLVQDNGQWRIDTAPNGTIMSQASFVNAYARSALYFPSVSADALVADPRWYPSRRVTTYLLEGLVKGPRPSLANIVTNAMPAGTVIEPQHIDISGQVAKVQLNAPMPTDATAQRDLRWQITTTLAATRNIISVEISVAGQNLPQVSPPQAIDYSLDTPIVLTELSVGRLSGTTIRPLQLPAEPSSEARAVAVGPLSASPVAWVDGQGITVANPSANTAATISVDDPNAVHMLSIDRFGWVWAADNRGRALAAWSAADIALTASLASDTASQIRDIAVSPDGTRLLMVKESDGAASLWSAMIRRDGAGMPLAVDALELLQGISGHVLDVTWAGEQHALVALRDSADTMSSSALISVDIGGFVDELSVPTDLTTVTAGSNVDAVIIGLSDGTFQSRSGALWQLLRDTIVEVRYPG
ncbi:GerMN domain-containing protein [Schaalia suimastitidis]|uniref:GerMN domain-containing protein n=1 Tax=Schaalia suimastitidis TaxID=121163 RepID=UPI00047E4D34|nr:GerMN domain-containing protein [Schaalia suimastitidis]